MKRIRVIDTEYYGKITTISRKKRHHQDMWRLYLGGITGDIFKISLLGEQCCSGYFFLTVVAKMCVWMLFTKGESSTGICQFNCSDSNTLSLSLG